MSTNCNQLIWDDTTEAAKQKQQKQKQKQKKQKKQKQQQQKQKQKQKQKQQKQQKQKQKQQKQKQKQKKQKQKQKQKQNQKNPESLGFLHVLFFHLFFYFVFFIAKIPRFISKQKNQSCEKNLGQVHSGLFLCICLFFGFFFVVPSPTVQKLEENQKQTKKPIL